MTSILFSRVNFLSILVVIFFRILGYKTYYLRTETLFNSDFFRRVLKEIGILHLSYDDFSIKDPEPKIDAYVNQVSLEFGNDLAKVNPLFIEVNKRLGGGGDEINAFGIVVSSYFNSLAIETAEMTLFCNAIYKNSNIQPILFCKKSYISNKVLLISKCNCRNIEPYSFLIVEYFALFLYRLLLNTVKLLFKAPQYLKAYLMQNNNNEKSCDSKEFSVAFIPHQGLLYESFFKKDQYYSNNIKSPLFSKNILHLLYKDDIDSLNNSIEYYKSNNLPFMDFFDLSTSRNLILKDIFWMIFQLLRRRAWVKLDFSIMVSVFMTLYSTRDSMLRLKNISGLKLVLYGYDVLFPKSISYACKLLDISTAASQERHFFPWGESSLIVDHYFVIGPAVENKIRINDRYDVEKIYIVGSPRLDEIYKQFCILSDRKKLLNGCQFLSIVLDFHSNINEYDNERSYNNNWNSNRDFYSVIINAAMAFPEVMFLIKGKNADFIKIPFFRETVNQINQINNISIVTDYTKVSPYYYASICDFSIAIYTSISDEILQSRKPVLLYDGLDKGIPNSDIGFDGDVVAISKEDLVKKIDLIVNNNYSNKVFDLIYKPTKDSVKLNIKNQLTNIYNLI